MVRYPPAWPWNVPTRSTEPLGLGLGEAAPLEELQAASRTPASRQAPARSTPRRSLATGSPPFRPSPCSPFGGRPAGHGRTRQPMVPDPAPEPTVRVLPAEPTAVEPDGTR